MKHFTGPTERQLELEAKLWSAIGKVNDSKKAEEVVAVLIVALANFIMRYSSDPEDTARVAAAAFLDGVARDLHLPG